MMFFLREWWWRITGRFIPLQDPNWLMCTNCGRGVWYRVLETHVKLCKEEKCIPN